MKSRSLNILFFLLWLWVLVVDSIEAWRSRELGRFALIVGLTVVSIAGFFLVGRYLEQLKASRFFSAIAGAVAVIVIALLAYETFW